MTREKTEGNFMAPVQIGGNVLTHLQEGMLLLTHRRECYDDPSRRRFFHKIAEKVCFCLLRFSWCFSIVTNIY